MPQILRNLFALLLIVLAETEKSFGQQTNCGPYLDMVLRQACTNGFNPKFKKSTKWNDQLPYANFPFLAKLYSGQVDTLK